MKFRQFVMLCSTASVLAWNVPAQAQPAPSAASAAASAALSRTTASVVDGSPTVLALAASLTVSAVEQVGESVVLVLKDASSGAAVSVQVSAKAMGTALVSAGSVLTVSASAAGYSLYQLGRLIAFVPNEVGRSLVHHSSVKK